MILSTFEHVYIVTQWYPIDFSEMNDNKNVLFEILLLSDKFLVLSNMEIAFAADNTAVKQNSAGPNIQRNSYLRTPLLAGHPSNKDSRFCHQNLDFS